MKASLIIKNSKKLLKILNEHYKNQEYIDALIIADQIPENNENFIEVQTIKGNSLLGLGKYDQALESYAEILKIFPKHSLTFFNIGVLKQKTNEIETAVKCYQKCLRLDDTNYGSSINLVNIYLSTYNIVKAKYYIDNCISLKPDEYKNYSIHGSLSFIKGDLEESLKSFIKLVYNNIEIQQSWQSIYIVLKAMRTNLENNSFYLNKIKNNAQDINHYIAVSKYLLCRGGKFQLDGCNILKKQIAKYELKIRNPEYNFDKNNNVEPKEKIVALKYFGRSGTGLLHSLIDSHPEVSTIPGIYLSQYFNQNNWANIIKDGFSSVISNFIDTYSVIFDADALKPIIGPNGKPKYEIGISEGMTNVGEKKNEVLRIDKDKFTDVLKNLMSNYEYINSILFFKLVHLSFNKSIDDNNYKKIIFYHIHDPDTYSQMNFSNLEKDSKWIMMVRDPIQNLESMIKNEMDNVPIVDRSLYISTTITDLLIEIDNPIYRLHNSIGLRLEDLKKKPKRTIPILCEWLGIVEHENLYRMTAQGKKWWGDPSSPDYKNDGMDPFGQTSINRKVGKILSQNDQFILRTLFYPFRVLFGYVKEDKNNFEKDLKEVEPMIAQLFDFEKKIVKEMKGNDEEFKKSGSYLFLRSVLKDRLALLNEFKTYPNMIKPLLIK